MAKKIQHFVTLNNKKYVYEIHRVSDEVSRFVCQDAGINQEFLNQDIPQLLIDLPEMIKANKEYADSKSTVIRFRISVEDKQEIESKAIKEGYSNISSYLRDKALS